MLQEILQSKRSEVEGRKGSVRLAEVEARARDAGETRSFRDALLGVEVGIIAEVKRRSPSAGELGGDRVLTAIARAYELGGACALSVLTDANYFGGRDGDVAACRAATDLPVLRKDFVIDPYQIAESRALGADAVLLIARALPGPRLEELAALAAEWRLDALVEVHDERDLERALALPDPIIGINNRDLETMTTDLEVTERLVAHVPPWVTVVSESGIDTRDDVERLVEAGVRVFLIGASLLRSGDPAIKIKELRGFTE